MATQHILTKQNGKELTKDKATANIRFWHYWGLTNIASAFLLYCALVRARRYKFGL